MKMPCHITDEYVYNDPQDAQDSPIIADPEPYENVFDDGVDDEECLE